MNLNQFKNDKKKIILFKKENHKFKKMNTRLIDDDRMHWDRWSMIFVLFFVFVILLAYSTNRAIAAREIYLINGIERKTMPY